MIDVLIVGSGGAGLSAALKAKEIVQNVVVISKTYPTHSQTCQAQGGINAILEEKEDSIKTYINDTYKASHKLGNKKHIQFLCEKSKEIITWLDSIGVPFSRDEKGNIAQRKFGGTKAQRTCYSSDFTGLKILHTLYDQCLKNEIKFYNEYSLLELIHNNNEIKGATFLNIQTGEIKYIQAKTIILASGGYAGLYEDFTTNSYASTGEGIALALKAGAKISNLEFIQFHPTSLEEKNILISESARGEGAYLIDEDGKRFIDELKPRDEVARAIYEKHIEGKKVYLDLRHIGLDKIKDTMPQERQLVYDFLKLKLEKDLIPVIPSAHYTMGGILTNIKAQTSVDNLYACGECSQSGIHGANRLGGNSLLEIISFGKIAGNSAAEKAKSIYTKKSDDKTYTSRQIKKIEKLLRREKNLNLYTLKKDIGKMFFKKVGLFREENELKEVLNKLEQIKGQLHLVSIEDKNTIYNKTLLDYLEFENALILYEGIVKSALLRKESRGSHFRKDYSQTNEDYSKNSISVQKKEKLEIYFEELL